jgi:hypothetical protein
MIDIKKINGNEIIDYLNSLTDDELTCDISCEQPYIFESQETHDGKYSLTFSTYFNNWGTDQLIEDNTITITNDGIMVMLGEPFDGDGSDEILEELLTKWLKTHEFSTEYKDDFNCFIMLAKELLSKCEYGDSKLLEQVIEKLTKAKTFIK